ncbi:MAG: hypothetical protein JW981_09875 [Anaerolineae bacterium]|nr:hypothetical protein [Anaerolineae bacterium]
MNYITSVEKIGYQRGVKEGLEQGLEQGIERTTKQAILKVLEVRFGKLSASTQTAITNIEDISRLSALLEQAAAAASLDAFMMALD